MHIEKAFWVFHGAREIVDQDGRSGRGNDDVGPDAFGRRRQHLALELDHFGHAFEHQACAAQRGGHILRRDDGDASNDRGGVGLRQQSEPRETRQRFSDFAERLGFEG